MTLPFRSYLSKLGIRLAKRFKNVRCIFITFLHLQSMRVVKKVHVPFKNSLSSQKKKKRTFKDIPIQRTNLLHTSQTQRKTWLYFAQIDRIVRRMHTRGKSTIRSTDFPLELNYIVRRQRERRLSDTSKGIIVRATRQTVSNQPRLEHGHRIQFLPSIRSGRMNLDAS